MDNVYTYDAVSNVLSVANKAALPESGKAGGQMAHAYTYDALYRLSSATETYAGADSKTASYRLEMGYEQHAPHRAKKQHLTRSWACSSTVRSMWRYDLAYTYGKTEGKKFQLAEVKKCELPHGRESGLRGDVKTSLALLLTYLLKFSTPHISYLSNSSLR